jgi:hypothetical protein
MCTLPDKHFTLAIADPPYGIGKDWEKRNKLGRLLKIADDFHKAMDCLVESGMSSHSDNCTDVQAFDAIMHDANFLCYLYALTGNCNNGDDEIKIISTIKALAKDTRISDNLLNKLNYLL